MPEDNGRTHEPSLRELVAELDGLRELLMERDKRYDERFVSAKEMVKTAFDSAEKAITKAEQAQTTYNQTHNDVQRQRMAAEQLFAQKGDLEKGLLRSDERIDDLKKSFETYQTLQAVEIRSLRESRSALSGAWMAMIAVSALVGSAGGFLLHALAGK